MVTTPLAMRSSVCAQLAGELGMPGAGTAPDGTAGSGGGKDAGDGQQEYRQETARYGTCRS